MNKERNTKRKGEEKVVEEEEEENESYQGLSSTGVILSGVKAKDGGGRRVGSEQARRVAK